MAEIIGYGEGKDAIFHRVVLVCGDVPEASELGLVTNETADAAGRRKLIVFVPGAPNPTAGRLIVIDAERTVPLAVSVSVPAPCCTRVPKPLPLATSSRTEPLTVTLSERLKTITPLLVRMMPLAVVPMLPTVPPLPTCNTPAPTVVAPG